jgi:hypothetical protein
MTTLSTKPTTRETSAYVRDRGMRALIITVHGSLIELRAKGLRQRETLDIASLYSYAVKGRIAREKAEKRAARKARGARA